MIVDQLNALLTGGAAKAALQLHRSLLQAGVDSRFWHDHPGPEGPVETHCARLPRPANSRRWLARLTRAVRDGGRKLSVKWQLKRHVPRYTMFTLPRQARLTPREPSVLGGQILHLHWTTRLLDWPSFFASVPDELPIVWTLHDLNPMTGGCHYAGGCDAFESGCGNCPQLRGRGPRDLSWRMYRIKQAALQGKNLHLVAPSRWLAELAGRSPLLSTARSLQVIPYGMPVELLAPVDRRTARQALGLPEHVGVIGFGADYFGIQNRRKGFPELMRALQCLAGDSPLVCLAFGHGEVPASHGNVTYRSLGYLHEPRELATVYSAADVYVLPSLEDNLPITGLEAMSCGTPIVAFATGGIPEYVRPGETGWLAPTGDSAQLAQGLQWMLAHPVERERMGRAARDLTLREFHHARQAQKYVELYHSLWGAPSQQRAA